MTSASKGLRSEGTAATRVEVLLNHSFHHHRIPFEACFFFCVLVVVCVFLISEVGFFFSSSPLIIDEIAMNIAFGV